MDTFLEWKIVVDRRHLWRLGVDKRLLAVYILIIIIIIIIIIMIIIVIKIKIKLNLWLTASKGAL